MKNIFLFFAVILFTVSATFAQKESKIDIKTFFHCANGKALIEKEMAKVDGVKEVVANLETKVVSIKYDTAKQNKESLVKAIETIGYKTEFSAEDVKINKACSHDDPNHKEAAPQEEKK